MIKFQKHYVTNGTLKARVHYSAHRMVSTGQECVTLYAKSYNDGDVLAQIITSTYENATDARTDYFEKGRVRITKDSSLYEAALSRC